MNLPCKAIRVEQKSPTAPLGRSAVRARYEPVANRKVLDKVFLVGDEDDPFQRRGVLERLEFSSHGSEAVAI